MAQAMGWVGGEQNTGLTYQGDAATQLYRYNINGNANEVVHCASNGGHGINAKMITLFEEWVESDGQTITVTAPSNTYNITVQAFSNVNYTLNGNDRNGLVSGNDPTVTVQAGDTINFNVNAGGHPFYIKTVYVGGTSNQVTTGTITGTQGLTNGTISWNTTGVSAGTYYYICSPHAFLGMGGSIVVT
jgi:plastocyanin